MRQKSGPDCASVLTFLRDNAATNAGHGTIRVDSKKSEPAANSDCTKVLFVRSCPPVETY